MARRAWTKSFLNLFIFCSYILCSTVTMCVCEFICKNMPKGSFLIQWLARKEKKSKKKARALPRLAMTDLRGFFSTLCSPGFPFTFLSSWSEKNGLLFDRELCSKVLKRALLSLILMAWGKHEQKMFQIEQKMFLHVFRQTEVLKGPMWAKCYLL